MPTLAIGLGVQVVPIAGTLTAKPVLAVAIGAAAVIGVMVLVAARRPIGQTTLTAPWWWSLAALVAWAGMELADAFSLVSSGNLEPLRLAAIALSFCPVVAVLGAKRPQHAAWSFVVLSLWAITTLPAAENFFLHPGQKLALGDARAWFLWILILLGPINYVPTRFAFASVLLAIGQIVALGPYLALLHRPVVGHHSAVGLLLAASALVAGWLAARRTRHEETAYDRLWLDFRDAFGLLWSLRVQERVNAVAQQNGWELELAWNGFCRPTTGEKISQIDPAIEPALRTSLTGLLRRFVSSDWIATRRPEPAR